MLVKFKKGVKLAGIRAEIAMALPVISRVWEKWGQEELVVTSALDGKHSAGSRHYAGAAIDLRVWGFAPEQLPEVVKDLQLCLNGRADNFVGDFDVCLESDHIHLEFDPQES